MLLAEEALRVHLVDVLGAGWSRGEPRVLRDHLDAADRRAVAGRSRQHVEDRLAGKLIRADLLGGQPPERRLLRRRGRDVDPPVDRVAEAARRARGRPRPGRRLRVRSSPPRPGRGSARPCRSSRPSRPAAGTTAPALSSPPNPSEPSSRPSTNHLNPTGTSTSGRPRSAVTRSMMLLLTSVLPTAALRRPLAVSAEEVCDAGREMVVGVEQPRAGVTMPCLSASGSLANATSKSSLSSVRRAIAWGEEQSILMRAVPVDRHEGEGRIDSRRSRLSGRAHGARRWPAQ